MATFADLLSDIIMAIIRSQYPDDKIVSGWKHTLRILSICRSWRAAMLPVVYGTVFIVVPQDLLGYNQPGQRRMPYNYQTPYTNAGLIRDNGYEFLVKRMFIRILSRSQEPFPWLYVAEVLNIDEDKYPGISAVREWIESDTDAEYQLASQNSACINAFGPIAHVLALRFPNVSSLRIEANLKDNSTQTYVIGKLVSAYASQLVKVDLYNFYVNPEFLKATNIRYFNKKVVYDFKDAPFINPKSLVCLKLHSSSSKNIWNQFACDKGTKSIEFSNLETLQLSCDESNDDVPLNTKDWHLKFPKLIHLKVNYDMISNLDIQHMASKLKTLDYTGPVDIAIKLLENNFGGLEKLHMDLQIYSGDEPSTRQLISQTNTIFSMVGSIPEVSCTGLEAHNLHMSSIYWPNLTRLEFTTSIEPYEFLRSVDHVPHLQHLYLKIVSPPDEADEHEDPNEDTDDSGDDEYDRRDRSEILDWSFRALSRLSDLGSGQSQSKLETLSIRWLRNVAFTWYWLSLNSRKYAEEDPELVGFFKSDGDSDYSLSSGYGCYRDAPMEDEETDAALRAYFPNLVATKFVYAKEVD